MSISRMISGLNPVRAVLTIVLFAGLAAVPAPAHAQDPTRQDSVFRIEGLLIRTVQPITTAGGAAALQVRIDSLDLPPASTVADVMREMPLVQVRRNSRGETHFAIRGAGTDTRQAAVLVDGVPLTLAWDARTDLSVVPTTAATSLTLTRGAPSVLYGPNALGGVVMIGIASGLDAGTRPALELGSSVEHTGSYALSATGTRPFDLGDGTLVMRGGVGYRDSDGLVRPDGVTELAEFDEDFLHNSDARQIDGFLGARYSARNGAWASLSASGFDAERGVLPELHTVDPRLWRYPDLSRVVAAVSGGTGHHRAIAGGTGDLEASVGIDLGETMINSFETVDYEALAGTEKGEDRTLTLRLLGDHTLGEHADLSAALTYADITHDETIDQEATVRYRQRLWSGALESTFRLGDLLGTRDTRLTVGGVVDGADTPETGGRPPQEQLNAWGARIGATTVAADGKLLLHATASRRARFPALRELYSGALGRFEPNPNLEPEKLVVGELGATVHVGGTELQAVGFLQRLTDAVVRISTPAGNFMRVNRDELRSRGVELLALMPLGPLQLAADATFQRIDLIDPTASDTESHPEYQPEVVAGLNVDAPLPADFKAGVQARYTGTQYCVNPDVGGDQELDPWTRLDARLVRGFDMPGSGMLRRAEASVSVDNVLDDVLFDQCGLPQAGRTLRVQVRLF